MPSHEDYLDSLLRNVGIREEELEDMAPQDAGADRAGAGRQEPAPDVDAPEAKVMAEASSAAEKPAAKESAAEQDEAEDLDFLTDEVMAALESAADGEDGTENFAKKDPPEQLLFQEQPKTAREPEEAALEKAPDLDEVTSMSEEEIERLLSAGQEEAGEEEWFPETESGEGGDWDQDVLGLLQDTQDSDLQDIQELLSKADNNEAVDEEVAALLQEPPAEDMAARILEEESAQAPMTEKEKRARARREKAAAKKAKKAAQKEAKAQARAAAKAAKAQSKGEGETPKAAPQAQTAKAPAKEKDASGDALVDTALLDAIVSAADQGQETDMGDLLGGEEPADLEGAFFQGEETPADEEAFLPDGAPEAEVPDKEPEGAEDFGFDMGSLFGETDDAALGAGEGLADEGASFPDFLDPDNGDRVDALLEREQQEKPKAKKGLLSRLVAFLTEEEPEPDNEDIQLSDENRNILSDLDKEKAAGKKKKKKGRLAAVGGDEGQAETKKGAKKPKKAKKKKPEKPKKEKIPEPEPLIPERKLTLKRMLPVLLTGASAGVLLLVFVYASVSYTGKQTAKEAYQAGDYQTCYENLYGKELNETEQMMFGTSESMLKMRLWLREYEMFAAAGSEIEALDCLIQTVQDYPGLYEYAQQWNAGSQLESSYETVLSILSSKYGLTESQALEIAHARSDLEYTMMVVDVTQGKGLEEWEGANALEGAGENGQPLEGGDAETLGEPLADPLPEEEDLTQGGFIENP